jgi:hypothetical protein
MPNAFTASFSELLKARESYKWLKMMWECMRRNREIQQSAGPDFVFLSFDEFIEQEQKADQSSLAEFLEPGSVKYHLDKSKLSIEIDLDDIFSYESLKKMVSEIIDQCVMRATIRKDITPKKRPNMTDFDLILKVGDMKREGKKNQEIAKTIHPRKYAKNPESAIRLVCYYNKRYKDLIDNKGFNRLGFP